MRIAREDETKEMFAKNLRLLSPWLRDSVRKIKEEELWDKIKITYNAEGYPVCRYRQGKRCFQVTSEHPIEEAEKWGETVKQQGTGVIFLYGTGFGYSLFEIFAHKKANTLVIAFEQDLYLFAAMLHYFDLEPIIQTQKIMFLVGDSSYFANAFDQVFTSVLFYSCTFPSFVFSLTSQRNFKNEYRKIHQYVFSKISLFVFYVGNDHTDILIGLRNLLANTKEVLQNPYIDCLKDQYKDVPAFIIANGPSLDKNMALLKDIKGRGLIFSVESAIVPLTKNGIKPDILTIIERSKETYTYHFENRNYPEDIALLCLGLVDPEVFPSFRGPKIPIFRKGEAINQWFNEYLGDGSDIDAGANVSHLAVELACYLGANPIILVGQDYAYGSGGVTHSKDASYSEEIGKPAREIIQSMPVIYVEGNDGNPIATNGLWADFKLGLELKIASHPEHVFRNATQGGAKIEGVKCVTLESAIKEYCTKPLPQRVNAFILEKKAELSLSDRLERLKKFRDSVQDRANLFHGLVKETIHGKLKCKEMLRLSMKENHEQYSEILNQTYQNNLAVYWKFLGDSLSRHFTQQIFFVYFYYMNRLGTIDSPEKVTEILKIQYNFFNHLNVTCQSVTVHLENAVEYLNGELRNFEHTDEKE